MFVKFLQFLKRAVLVRFIIVIRFYTKTNVFLITAVCIVAVIRNEHEKLRLYLSVTLSRFD